jgi:hypothetical protein
MIQPMTQKESYSYPTVFIVTLWERAPSLVVPGEPLGLRK